MRISDWSSDVCSSDLCVLDEGFASRHRAGEHAALAVHQLGRRIGDDIGAEFERTLERGGDRKSVVKGTSVSVRVDLGGRRIIKKKNIINSTITNAITNYNAT